MDPDTALRTTRSRAHLEQRQSADVVWGTVDVCMGRSPGKAYARARPAA